MRSARPLTVSHSIHRGGSAHLPDADPPWMQTPTMQTPCEQNDYFKTRVTLGGCPSK